MNEKKIKFVCGDDLTPRQLKQVMKAFNNRTYNLALFCDNNKWPSRVDLEQPNYIALATELFEDPVTRIYTVHHKNVLPEF